MLGSMTDLILSRCASLRSTCSFNLVDRVLIRVFCVSMVGGVILDNDILMPTVLASDDEVFSSSLDSSLGGLVSTFRDDGVFHGSLWSLMSRDVEAWSAWEGLVSCRH